MNGGPDSTVTDQIAAEVVEAASIGYPDRYEAVRAVAALSAAGLLPMGVALKAMSILAHVQAGYGPVSFIRWRKDR